MWPKRERELRKKERAKVRWRVGALRVAETSKERERVVVLV